MSLAKVTKDFIASQQRVTRHSVLVRRSEGYLYLTSLVARSFGEVLVRRSERILSVA